LHRRGRGNEPRDANDTPSGKVDAKLLNPTLFKYSKMNNPREKKYEEVCRVTSCDFCVRWIGSSEDVLLPEPRAFPYLL
jgi:hypothetical protein